MGVVVSTCWATLYLSPWSPLQLARLPSGGSDSRHGENSKFTTLVRDRLLFLWFLETFLALFLDLLRLTSGGRDSKHGGNSRLTTLVRGRLLFLWFPETFLD